MVGTPALKQGVTPSVSPTGACRGGASTGNTRAGALPWNLAASTSPQANSQPDNQLEWSISKHEAWDKRRESLAQASIRPSARASYTAPGTQIIEPSSNLLAPPGTSGGAPGPPPRHIRPSDSPKEPLSRIPRSRPDGVADPWRAAPNSTRGDQLALPTPPRVRLGPVVRLFSSLRGRAACGLGRGRRLSRPQLGHLPLQLGRQIFQDAQLFAAAFQS